MHYELYNYFINAFQMGKVSNVPLAMTDTHTIPKATKAMAMFSFSGVRRMTSL